MLAFGGGFVWCDAAMWKIMRSICYAGLQLAVQRLKGKQPDLMRTGYAAGGGIQVDFVSRCKKQCCVAMSKGVGVFGYLTENRGEGKSLCPAVGNVFRGLFPGVNGAIRQNGFVLECVICPLTGWENRVGLKIRACFLSPDGVYYFCGKFSPAVMWKNGEPSFLFYRCLEMAVILFNFTPNFTKTHTTMSAVYFMIGFILVVLLLLCWWIITYNQFIAANNRVKQAESAICVMLKQRNDMIPNLVETVRNYIGHENVTLTKIAELRASIGQATSEKEQVELGAQLSRKLADIKVAVEAYPELKADKHFLRLEESIEEMEYQLQAARRTFNATVVWYNNRVQMFPSSIIAGMNHYRCYDLITIPEAEKANVDVKSLFKPS
jgi:LemA protein